MITKRQREAIEVVAAFHLEHGYAPSFRDIAWRLGIRSKASVNALLCHGRNAGYLTWVPGDSRTIVVTSKGRRMLGLHS